MEKASVYRNSCSIIIIAVLAVFLFLLRYDVPLYGDDVGGLVSNNPDSTYIDGRIVEEECELNVDYSFRMTWTRLVDSYLQWNGRVISKAVMPLIRWMFSLPDGISWILFSLYIMAMEIILLLLAVQIICGSIKSSMNAPMVVLLTAVLVYLVPSYSYAYMTRLVMYTFTNIYVISVILYLCFYILIRRKFGQTDEVPGVRSLIGINVVGLLAGLSHEAYGVIFGAVLLTQLVRFWLENHRRISIRYLFMYAGYLVGFCICFFAPGNFNRAAQSHESALRTVPLIQRLANSIYIHAFIAYKVWIVPVIVIPVLLIAVIVLLKKRILTLKEVIRTVAGNLEWFFGFAISAVTWGLVARVVNYGLLAANVLLIIGVIRVLREWWLNTAKRVMAGEDRIERVRQVLAGLSIVVVLAMIAVNYSELMTVHQTADVWREQICLARNAGMEEIEVPAYPTDVNPKFYDVTPINDQNRYDLIAYRVVYGTHVIINDR